MLERDVRLVALVARRAITRPRSPARSRSRSCAARKRRGLAVTASASINHLTLNENDIGSYRTFFKVSPPLRAEEDRVALVDGAGGRA